MNHENEQPAEPRQVPSSGTGGTPEQRRIVIRAPEAAPEGDGHGAAATAAPAEVTSPSTSPRASLGSTQIAWGPVIAGIGGLLAAFSIAFPWWSLTYRNIELLDSSVSGLSAWPGIVSVVAAWVMLLALAYDIQRPGSSTVPLIGLAAGLVLTLACALAVVSPASVVEADPAYTVHVGLGTWMALVGGLAGLAGYGVIFAQRR